MVSQTSTGPETPARTADDGPSSKQPTWTSVTRAAMHRAITTTQRGKMYAYADESEFDERVVVYAEAHGLDVGELDWHLEAFHGWERHDRGYAEAIPFAANCTSSECDLTWYRERHKLKS